VKRIFLVLLSSLIVGCVSTHMKKYVGRDIRDVMLDSGPPMNAFDMPDGTRAFQFRWGGGSFALPQMRTTSGTVTAVGNSAWFQSQSISSGGNILSSEGCIITYFAKWNEGTKSWTVVSFRHPKQLVC
jgi:hypothetical protein